MPTRDPNRRAELLAHAALLVLALALHSRFLAGEALVSWDQTAVGTPWRRPTPVWNPLLNDTVFWEWTHVEHHVRRGGDWNPYSALGEPEGTFTHPFHAYPPAMAAYAVCEPWRAKGLLTLLHVALGGAAMLRWLRWRGSSVRAALAGAVAYQLSTEVTVWLEFGHRATVAGWAPLVLWGAEATARTLRLQAVVLTALAVGGAVVGGLVDQPGVLVCVVAGLVVVLHAQPGNRARALALGALAIGLGLGLAAVRLVPMALEMLDGSRRAASWSTWFETTCLLGPRHALTLLLPDLLGSPLRRIDLLGVAGQPYANYVEVRLYFGLPALLLALLGAGERGVRGLALVALAAVIVAFPTPLSWLPFVLVPAFSASGAVRSLWVAHLLVPVLVAAGVERLARQGQSPLVPRLVAGGVCLVVLLVGAVVSTPEGAAQLLPAGWGASPGERGALARELATWLDPTSLSAAVQVVEGEGRRGWMFSPTLGPALLAVATLGAVALGTAGSRRRRRVGQALLVGLLALDLLDRGILWNPTASPGALFVETGGIARTRQLAGAERAALDGRLHPNLLLPFGVRDVGGYQSMHPGRVKALLETVATPRSFGNVLKPMDASPAWRDALSVRVVLTEPGLAPRRPEGLVLDRAGPDVDVWVNPTALPRARLHPPEAVVTRADRASALEVVRAPWFDPRRHVVVERGAAPASDPPGLAQVAPPLPARLVQDEPERVVVEVEAPRGGLLVLADTHARGWTASAAGAPLELLPADVALRGVPLPPGFRGEVTFLYAAPGRSAGRAITLAAGLVLLLLLRAGRARA